MKTAVNGKKCPYCHQEMESRSILVDAFLCKGNGDPGDEQFFVESQEAGSRLLHPVDPVVSDWSKARKE